MTNTFTNENTTQNKTITTSVKTRNSGVELLRIIAIFLICLSHAVQTSEAFLNYNYLNFGIMILKILRYSGQVGNILFVICSSWFLLDSKQIKIEKVLKILLDSMFISIIIFIGFVISGYKFSLKEIVQQLFPDYFSNMWFIPVYAIFYLIHPFLNSAINGMNKKIHLTFCLIIFTVFGVLGFALGWDGIVMNPFLGFCVIYFIVAFIKKYCKNFYENKKINLIAFLILTFIFINLVVLKNICHLNHLYLDQFYSPILLTNLICLFNLFNGLNIKSEKINYFASCSLFVYCIHENILLRSIIRPIYYNKALSICFDAYFGWIILCAVGMFIGAYILSILYKMSISKLTNILSKTFTKIFSKTRDKIYNLMFENELPD